ncbi:unnamed protein product [Prunus brigantina]
MRKIKIHCRPIWYEPVQIFPRIPFLKKPFFKRASRPHCYVKMRQDNIYVKNENNNKKADREREIKDQISNKTISKK